MLTNDIVNFEQLAPVLQACAKEITFTESKGKMNEKLQTSSADCTQSCVTPKDTADQSATAVHLANQTDITKDHAADQSGISLNSSYVTLSVAETSSLSQGMVDLAPRFNMKCFSSSTQLRLKFTALMNIEII